MSTLLLRLAAPLQAWGTEAKFDRRTTERVPTKSGVTGLIAAALGRKRNEPVDDIAALRFGVRVERPGELLRDYHTAKSVKSAYVTHRYYLSDAVFLAGLEGDDELLGSIAAAITHPQFPLYLGRRSCPPEGRILIGIREGVSLGQALADEPRLTGGNGALSIMLEAAPNELRGSFMRDMPISFDQAHRRYGFRRVYRLESPAASCADITEHDPMAELE